jgi:ElaB/YqjD/DUF883 family membrane-anchored ribosome-binding protein
MAENTDTSANPAFEPAGTTSAARTSATPGPGSDFSSAAYVASAAGAGVAPGVELSAAGSEARSRFTTALDEARAGVDALRAEAADRTAAYRARAAEASNEWADQTRALSGQARDQALSLANEGKARASDGLAALGRTVADNAPALDEMLGTRYGDYARQAARAMQESAARIESKSYAELGEEAREFIRTNPAVAFGVAGVAGYFMARLFGHSDD